MIDISTDDTIVLSCVVDPQMLKEHRIKMIAQRAELAAILSSDDDDNDNADDNEDDIVDDDMEGLGDDDSDATPPPPSITSSSVDLVSSSLHPNSSSVGISSDPASIIKSDESKSNDVDSDSHNVGQPSSKRQKLDQQ